MHTYGMSYQSVMSMPMRAFWNVSGNVERLRAEHAMQKLEVGISCNSEEGAQAMREHLSKLTPSPFKLSGKGQMKLNAELDQEGLNDLRSLAAFG